MIRRLVVAFALMLAVSPGGAQNPAPSLAPAFQPNVLSPQDVTRYRKIIAAERAGSFATATALFEQVAAQPCGA